MRSSLRYKYDDKAIDYHSLLAYARVIEGETGRVLRMKRMTSKSQLNL